MHLCARIFLRNTGVLLKGHVGRRRVQRLGVLRPEQDRVGARGCDTAWEHTFRHLLHRHGATVSFNACFSIAEICAERGRSKRLCIFTAAGPSCSPAAGGCNAAAYTVHGETRQLANHRREGGRKLLGETLSRGLPARASTIATTPSSTPTIAAARTSANPFVRCRQGTRRVHVRRKRVQL